MAAPCPTPTHIVARPNFELRRFISCINVAEIRTPLHPNGWPMAMEPPLTFTFSRSSPRSCIQAIDCEAKASFSSTRSRSLTVIPARIHDLGLDLEDRKSTRLNSSHLGISYAVFCLKKKKN